MKLYAGNKYKLCRLKDLYCMYNMNDSSDYLRVYNSGEGLLNHKMDAYMGESVTIDRKIGYYTDGISDRYIINECSHSNFHIRLFEDYYQDHK